MLLLCNEHWHAASNSKGAPILFILNLYWRGDADKMLIIDLLKLVFEFDMKLTEANIENLEVSGEDDDDTRRPRGFRVRV